MRSNLNRLSAALEPSSKLVSYKQTIEHMYIFLDNI